MTELKVGGLWRTIIIPAGKSQGGWRTFGIELRRILEPSQYAVGGLNFVPYKYKQVSKIRIARSYVEVVKALVQARLKPIQQPFIKEKVKDGVVEKILERPRDNSHTQVVLYETHAGKFPQAAMGGGEGGEGSITGKNNIEEKIPEGNKLNIALNSNSNSKLVEFGKLHDNRRSRWRGLIVAVNEGKLLCTPGVP